MARRAYGELLSFTSLPFADTLQYQQIFCLAQALPGSASVKMLFCINTIHGGFLAGFLAFLLFRWEHPSARIPPYLVNHYISLPGALGMYTLSIGISHVGRVMPSPVYALLSGLNAATVGIVAVAGMKLASKAITDKITRFLVCWGALMGMLHTALW